MLTLSAILAIVLQFSPNAEIQRLPVGSIAYASDCLMQSAVDGVVIFCHAENIVMVMSTAN